MAPLIFQKTVQNMHETEILKHKKSEKKKVELIIHFILF